MILYKRGIKEGYKSTFMRKVSLGKKVRLVQKLSWSFNSYKKICPKHWIQLEDFIVVERRFLFEKEGLDIDSAGCNMAWTQYDRNPIEYHYYEYNHYRLKVKKE